MSFQFTFSTAGRIIFGKGALAQVAPIAETYGKRVLVVMGRSIAQTAPLLEQFKLRRIDYALFSVPGEPTVGLIEEALAKARDFQPQAVIGMGGGSAVDAAKAISALYTNSGDILDYLEVIGAGKPLTQPPLPLIAVPTTAGTGSEVTKNAVLRSEAHRVKVSLRHERMLPAVAIVDPLLTLTVPPEVTAATGLDAITQLIEPLVSMRANPFVDAICRQGLQMAASSLLAAVRDGSDETARENMSFAALCGGMALANAGLGAVHGFAGVIGGMFPAPHGAVCARLLPVVMEANIRALTQREPLSPALIKYQEIAVLLTGDPQASAAHGCAWIRDLCDQLNVPPLSVYGVTHGDVEPIVAQSIKASSMKANPIVLDLEALTAILIEAL